MTLRAPTPHDVLYAWYHDAMASPGIRKGIPDEPRCGWFKRRFVKGGIFVPAKIWVYQWTGEDGELLDDEKIQCEVNGGYADPVSEWAHLCGRPISEQEWNYMEAVRKWAIEHAPNEPHAQPRKKIDLMTVRIPFGEN